MQYASDPAERTRSRSIAKRESRSDDNREKITFGSSHGRSLPGKSPIFLTDPALYLTQFARKEPSVSNREQILPKVNANPSAPSNIQRISRYLIKQQQQQQQQQLKQAAKSKQTYQTARKIEQTERKSTSLQVSRKDLPTSQIPRDEFKRSLRSQLKEAKKTGKSLRPTISKDSKQTENIRSTKNDHQPTNDASTLRSSNAKTVSLFARSEECRTPTNFSLLTDPRKKSIDVGSETDASTISNARGSFLDDCEFTLKERCSELQQQVEEAIKCRKIFLIRGDIPYLEESMKARGWVQKYESTKTRMTPYGSVASLDAPSLGNIQLPDGTVNEKAMTFHFLRHVPPDFIWDCRNDFTEWNGNVKPDAFLNRFQKSFLYTSKLGMAAVLEDAHWYYEENVSNVRYPRCYNVTRDKRSFVEDYRRTAATSLLKWFVEQIQQNGKTDDRTSSYPLRPIEFAIKRCEEILAFANDENLDVSDDQISSREWEAFVEDYVKVVHRGNFSTEPTNDLPSSKEIEALYATAMEVLNKIRTMDPQFELNGYRNIWILKPSDLCCGTGIIMTHKLNYILRKIHDSAKDYFVVQKYIEKPLLVQGTKFDVRQWYLVTKSYPLTIWIYKESLLRFSSRPFSFTNYHEAIHICNTAVQCRYSEQPNSVRAMDWDCEKINEYLKQAGHEGEPWHEQIYPKMCEAIVATMLAAQQHMDKRKCSFELYGADFVIMDDLSVWLIEINTNPRMHPPSTKVTERLYPDVMESLLKVILDYPSNPNADTGNFVLAYQQNVTNFQPYSGVSMFVLGKSMTTKPKSSCEMENCWSPWIKAKHNESTMPDDELLNFSNPSDCCDR